MWVVNNWLTNMINNQGISLRLQIFLTFFKMACYGIFHSVLSTQL